ncbi:MAG: heavy-metal-associated domain-containing protein [Planctomycetota bacterium]
MQCVSAVRGELGSLEGVRDVYIRANIADFTVRYDPEQVRVEAILAALDGIGEPAQLRARR